ncbi:MAG: hypothetical protein ACOZNI_28945 [Myxococcota bacterium]
MIPLLLACAGGPAGDSGSADADTGSHDVTGYAVDWWTDPDAATAGAEAEFYLHFTDQDGHSIEDLQTNHERIVHTILVSADLESFTHIHHEDFYDLTVDDIRDSTFHFPITFPYSGEYLAIFDSAHRNQWLQVTDTVEVGGDIVQRDSYDADFSTERDLGDVRVALSWEIEPLAGYEASFTARITARDGSEVTDLTQYLGADGHMAVVSVDLAFASHTHAWFPGMEDMSPTMEMPHVYAGPDLPFHYTFPVGGTYKMWIQFSRESAPGVVYAAPFLFEVAG